MEYDIQPQCGDRRIDDGHHNERKQNTVLFDGHHKARGNPIHSFPLVVGSREFQRDVSGQTMMCLEI